MLVCGDVTDGIERLSTTQLFIIISKNFNGENGLKAISESKIKKASILSLVKHEIIIFYHLIVKLLNFFRSFICL